VKRNARLKIVALGFFCWSDATKEKGMTSCPSVWPVQ
jgi:hypothetical protein